MILPVGAVQAPPPVAVQAPPPVAVQAPPPVAVQAPPPVAVQAPPPVAVQAPPQGAFRPPQPEASFNLDNDGIASGSLGTDMPGIPAEAPPPGGTSDARINLPPGVAGSDQDLMDRYRAGLSELTND